MIIRTITIFVEKALGDWGKVVLLSGPRQAGKTTLAKALLGSPWQGTYFNWDVITDQRRLVEREYFYNDVDINPARPALAVLDEFHKYPDWKNWLKGAWDRDNHLWRFLVTGSGRLDLFRKGADSLLGRSIGVPLFPLSLGELGGTFPGPDAFAAALGSPPSPTAQDVDNCPALMRLGGFPEPYVRGQEDFQQIWRQERNTMLIRQDIRDATGIRDIAMLQVLGNLVPGRVGSPLSVNSLREDLGVAHETVSNWLQLFEQFYFLFSVSPWAGSLARSLKKERKVYLFDWTDVRDEGPRFENMVAAHLYKAAATWTATGQGQFVLHYVRDREKREVDFLLVRDGRPFCLVECKSNDTQMSPAVSRFQGMLGVGMAVQVVNRTGVCRAVTDHGRTSWVMSADRFLAQLP